MYSNYFTKSYIHILLIRFTMFQMFHESFNIASIFYNRTKYCHIFICRYRVLKCDDLTICRNYSFMHFDQLNLQNHFSSAFELQHILKVFVGTTNNFTTLNVLVIPQSDKNNTTFLTSSFKHITYSCYCKSF